jgi:hypothetical protein
VSEATFLGFFLITDTRILLHTPQCKSTFIIRKPLRRGWKVWQNKNGTDCDKDSKSSFEVEKPPQKPVSAPSFGNNNLIEIPPCSVSEDIVHATKNARCEERPKGIAGNVPAAKFLLTGRSFHRLTPLPVENCGSETYLCSLVPVYNKLRGCPLIRSIAHEPLRN